MPRGPYDAAYQRARRAVIGLPCVEGCGRIGTTADHWPPLSSVRPGERWVGVLRPMCKTCMSRQGGRIGGRHRPPAPFGRSRKW